MPGQHGESKTSPRRLLAEKREREAYQMRLAGADFSEIAQALGYSRSSGAYHAVRRYLKKIHQEDAAVFKVLNLGRLHRLLMALWPQAIGAQGFPADPLAAEKAKGIIQEINRMMGLYEAVKVDMTIVRREAERVAAELGWTVDEVLAEADKIVMEARGT